MAEWFKHLTYNSEGMISMLCPGSVLGFQVRHFISPDYTLLTFRNELRRHLCQAVSAFDVVLDSIVDNLRCNWSIYLTIILEE